MFCLLLDIVCVNGWKCSAGGINDMTDRVWSDSAGLLLQTRLRGVEVEEVVEGRVGMSSAVHTSDSAQFSADLQYNTT